LVDRHTNSLIIQAVRSDLERMLPLIETLDRPTPQVLIEAHIVEATKDAARNLGVQWGGLYGTSINGYKYYNTAGDIANPAGSGVTPGSGESVNPSSGTMGNFPAGLTATDVAGNLLGLDLGFILESGSGNILSVQLQALEEEGQLNILSSPNITTLDNQQAFIESGRDVPYQSVEDDEVKIEYKKAVLRLEVTPARHRQRHHQNGYLRHQGRCGFRQCRRQQPLDYYQTSPNRGDPVQRADHGDRRDSAKN
jgi:type IV pilus assembly protein PilQ